MIVTTEDTEKIYNKQITKYLSASQRDRQANNTQYTNYKT
jgi:hypothetical protein